ncbi:hypothetical protein [Brassicibacter mesophilus]|uniref:hypothetical protein n=1 Tax=Brassicibacter mesophilus TaxID=745119 RepID=UPI003D1B45E7
MTEWWNSIPAFEKVFWYFAVPFSVLFLIQLISTFIGMNDDVDIPGDDGGFDTGTDFDGDGADIDGSSAFNLFTVRNFIIFFTVFGWTGIVGANANMNKTLTVILAMILGLIVMAIVSGIFYFMSRLTESGNMDLKNAMYCIGEVYITIPAKRSGLGKVQMTLQGSIRELEAMTDGKAISSGDMVRVIDIINNQILLVEKQG